MIKLSFYNDKNLEKLFLSECLEVLYKNLTLEERFTKKKLDTGSSVNKFDFNMLMFSYWEDHTSDTSIDYWLNRSKILKYHKQIDKVVQKYTYLIMSKGV